MSGLPFASHPDSDGRRYLWRIQTLRAALGKAAVVNGIQHPTTDQADVGKRAVVELHQQGCVAANPALLAEPCERPPDHLCKNRRPAGGISDKSRCKRFDP